MMQPLPLPGFVLPSPQSVVVNVASVKHRSPFRYPGGKTWLVPRARQWLMSLPEDRRQELIEPFAGGAIIGLSAAFERLTDHVTLVELDDEVAAVWESIITYNEGGWLAEQIRGFSLTRETVHTMLEHTPTSLRERAFQTIVRNRINRGGILAPGAGKLKRGENGKGIASRWYPETLARRILDIAAIRDRLTFIHGDGLDIIRRNLHRPDAVFFIDPPYTAAGKKPGHRLYTCSELDHDDLFSLARELLGDFLMTYDDVTEIEILASNYGFDWETVAMKNTHHAHQSELLICRDLGWLR